MEHGDFPDWSKRDEVRLASYVNPDATYFLGRLSENTFDLPDDPDGHRRILELIYNKLLESGISYDLEKFTYADDVQKIRTPTEILEGVRRGTSFDLSLLFAGLVEGYGLAPVVVVMEGHAFVMVSVKNGRSEWDSLGRSELGALAEPVKEIDVLRDLVASGNYEAIECTGFAASERLRDYPDAAYPETLGRDERGLMSFEQALTSGRAQLFDRPEQLEFALDVAVAHRRIDPHEIRRPVSVVSERRPAEAVALADPAHGTTSVEADRDAVALPRPVSPHLLPLRGFVDRQRELDEILSAVDSGRPVFLVGAAGVGKTALLRRLAYDDKAGADLPDGVVYMKVRDTPVEDVLQDIYGYFFRADEPQKPSESSIKRLLRNAKALIMLDDVQLPPDDVESILDLVPEAAFVIAGRAEKLQGGDFVRIELRGLPSDEALILLERQLGESIPEEERDAAREICRAVDGHPGLLGEAAHAVRDGESLTEVARRYQSTGPSATVAEALLTDLTPIQLKVAEILNAARVPVSLELLERVLADDLAGIPGELHASILALTALDRVDPH